MKRRSFDETESARVVGRPRQNELADLPLGTGLLTSAQPARTVMVSAHARVVDGTRAAEQEAHDHYAAYLVWRGKNEAAYQHMKRKALARLETLRNNPALRQRIGVKRVFEETRDEIVTDGFMDNSYTAYVARDLCSDVPELRPFIKLRALTSKHEAAA